MPATRADASGSTSQARRQLSPPIQPIAGMPTIQAAGWPTSAHESTFARDAWDVHSAAATVPAVVRTATPIPTGTCESARAANVGGRGQDRAGRQHAPLPRRAACRARSGRAAGGRRPAPSPRRPARPRSRSWPVAAVDTSRSLATSTITGDIAIEPACAAKRQRKSAAATAPSPRPAPGRACPARLLIAPRRSTPAGARRSDPGTPPEPAPRGSPSVRSRTVTRVHLRGASSARPVVSTIVRSIYHNTTVRANFRWWARPNLARPPPVRAGERAVGLKLDVRRSYGVS